MVIIDFLAGDFPHDELINYNDDDVHNNTNLSAKSQHDIFFIYLVIPCRGAEKCYNIIIILSNYCSN